MGKMKSVQWINEESFNIKVKVTPCPCEKNHAKDAIYFAKKVKQKGRKEGKIYVKIRFKCFLMRNKLIIIVLKCFLKN